MRKHAFSQGGSGFTLIELMVVVVIIGILMAAGIVVFTSVQQNTRDARRISDIRSIQKAFDTYQALNGILGSVTQMAEVSFVTRELPNPPQSDESYTISFNSSTQVYCICSPIEGMRVGNALTAGSNGSCSFTSDPSQSSYFCVTNDASLSTFISPPPSSEPSAIPSPAPTPSSSPTTGCITPWGISIAPNSTANAPTCGETYVYANQPDGIACASNRRHQGRCTTDSAMNFNICMNVANSNCP